MENTTIQCPMCGNEFNIENVLAKRYEVEYNQRLRIIEKEFKAKESVLQDRETDLQDKEAKVEQMIKSKVGEAQSLIEQEYKKAAEENTQRIRREAEEKLRKEFEVQLQVLNDEQSESNKKIAQLHTALVENEKLKREMANQKSELEVAFNQKLTQQLGIERELIRKKEQESQELKIRELEKKLVDQTKLAEEMRRKAEQGSMQLQGEVQELEIENMLRDKFERFGDQIDAIGKGQRGADVLHTVKTRTGDVCGKIYYESKRTKVFNHEWLQKLRDDNVSTNADILVIVTEAMPNEQHQFFSKDGVWICTLSELPALSLIFREWVVNVHNVIVVQQGVETKAELLYQYLNSSEFSSQFGAVLEGFVKMKSVLDKERAQMEKTWKEREKQLEKIILNMSRVYGSFKGIAGASIPDVAILEDSQPAFPQIEFGGSQE